MSLGYPWGTYVPIGVNDRSYRQQAALDAELDAYADLAGDVFHAAIAERMGVVIQDDEEEQPEEDEEENDPWLQFLIDQESPNVQQQ